MSIAKNESKNNEVKYEQIQGKNCCYLNTSPASYTVVVFQNGSGTHLINGKKFEIAKNQLHLLFPGQNHHLNTSPGTLGHMLSVGEEIFDNFSGIDEFQFVRKNISPVFSLPGKIAMTLISEMEMISRDMNIFFKDANLSEVIGLRMDILASIIKLMLDKYRGISTSGYKNYAIDNFWKLIESNYMVQKKPKWYASQLGIAPNYLNSLCQKHINTTATAVIHKRIVKEAKRLLKFSPMSIKEITFILGFDNMPAFSAFFKKNCGITPSEYRN